MTAMGRKQTLTGGISAKSKVLMSYDAAFLPKAIIGSLCMDNITSVL